MYEYHCHDSHTNRYGNFVELLEPVEVDKDSELFFSCLVCFLSIIKEASRRMGRLQGLKHCEVKQYYAEEDQALVIPIQVLGLWASL